MCAYVLVKPLSPQVRLRSRSSQPQPGQSKEGMYTCEIVEDGVVSVGLYYSCESLSLLYRNISNQDTNGAEEVSLLGVLVSEVEMHARVVLGVGKGVLFREVSSVQECPHRDRERFQSFELHFCCYSEC